MRITMFGFLLASALNLPAAVPGTVTASRLNVRVLPGTKYAVVAQLTEGAELEIHRLDGGWYEISAPESSEVWVSRSYIKDGRASSDIRLRAGPSVTYSAFKVLSAGTPVTVVDDSRDSWLRIKPPADLRAWVSAEYVSVSPADALKIFGGADAGSEKSAEGDDLPDADSEFSDKSELPSEDDSPPLPFLGSASEPVSVQGILMPLGADAVYVSHAVCTEVKGHFFPLCYLRSEKDNLKLWENQRILVEGEQRWVKGWQRPVVEVRTISPIQ